MSAHTPGARDGGDAFPSPGVVLPNQGGVPMQQGAYAGMSLRDYFAAKAMPSLLVGLIEEQYGGRDAQLMTERMALGAYRVADAMLKARSA